MKKILALTLALACAGVGVGLLYAATADRHACRRRNRRRHWRADRIGGVPRERGRRHRRWPDWRRDGRADRQRRDGAAAWIRPAAWIRRPAAAPMRPVGL